MLVRRIEFRKAGLLAAVSVLMFAQTARAEDIQVPPDQVRVVTFSAPAKTVFVGNPAIADVTVIDSTHVFVLGKNLGTTNIVALDAAGKEFANQQIVVLDRPGSMVTLQRGGSQTTLSCTSQRCVSIVSPGDDKGVSDTVGGQFERREEIANKAAGGSGGAQR